MMWSHAGVSQVIEVRHMADGVCQDMLQVTFASIESSNPMVTHSWHDSA